MIVAHNGTRWLPNLFTALEASTRFPDHLMAVDTGSTDETALLLTDVLGPSAVHLIDSGTGFGTAVQQGLDRTAADDPSASSPDGSPEDWLWLLHDDCAPAPDALEHLLDVAESDPGISVVGGRVRAWPRARRLLEVGVTVTGTGHRETGVEIGEYDQGQHDEQRDVLAVSSAGMLVRRETWDRLGGFDSRLPLFRDDLDFGWRVAKAGGRVVVAPQAVIFHAEAATRGVRTLNGVDHLPNSPHRADRQAALFTVLANCHLAVFPFQYVRLALGSVLRALAYLVGKLPNAAADELLAMVSVLGRPGVLIAARVRRRGTSAASHRSVRALLPRWWTPYANGLDSLLSRFAGTVRDTASQVAAAARRRRPGASSVEALESGPVPNEAVNLPSGAGPVAWMMAHPITTLAAGLTVLAAVATRDLWGGGWLQGGALLPAPEGGASWWQTYIESWHHVGLGSREAAAPYVGVLGVISTVLLGKSWLTIQLLVVLAVPLSAVGAYVVARRWVDSLATRAWMALSYALLPVLTGTVSSGHLGTTVAVIALPWLVRVAVPMALPERTQGWRAVFATGLVLALIVAFAPLAWPMAAVVALAVLGMIAVSARRRAELMLRPVVAVSLPALVLLPWSWHLLTTPALFLTEAGRVDRATPSVAEHAWALPWGRLAAAGDAPWWLSLGLVLAALVALLRTDRRPKVVAAWWVVGLGLVTTALLAGVLVTIPGTTDQAFVWVGLPVVVSQAAAIVAAGFAADGVGRVIQSGSFGWRQPLAAVTVVIALVGPFLGLGWWVGTAPEGSLTRAQAVPLPAYMIDAMKADAQQRILVISATAHRQSGTDEVAYSDTYTVYADDGYRLGDDSITATPTDAVTDLVKDLVSEAAPDDVSRLADLGIAYVVLPAPYDTDQVAQLDGLPGLSRASTNSRQLAGWQVDLPTGLVRVQNADTSVRSSAAGATVLASQDGHADARLEPGPDRVLRVSTDAADGFIATLDGARLDPVVVAAGAGFSVGTDGGSISVDPGGHRGWWVLGQGLVIMVLLVLAAPAIQPATATADEEEEA